MISEIVLSSALLPLALGAATSGSGYVHVHLKKSANSVHVRGAAHHLAQQNVPDQSGTYSGYQYWANLTLGGQPVSALVDTGSSDTFVFTDEAYPSGWVPGQSPNYHWINSDFTAAYGDDNQQISGSYVHDSIALGGVQLPRYQFGLLNESGHGEHGLFGLGPQSAESATTKYPTIYDDLKSAGITGSRAFSLYDAGADDAVLLFGAVDHAKHQGPLYTVPFSSNERTGNLFYTIDFQYGGQWIKEGVLDTSSPTVGVPSALIQPLVKKYNLLWDDSFGYYAPSGTQSGIPSFTITVGGIPINIDPFVEVNGKQYLSVQPADGIHSLGQPFLKAVYSIFDIENQVYGFAPINTSSSSNVEVISSSIPGAVPAPVQSSSS